MRAIPSFPDKTPLFEWAPGVPIDDIDDEDDTTDDNPIDDTAEAFMRRECASEIFEHKINDNIKNENHNDDTDADGTLFNDNQQINEEDNFLIDDTDDDSADNPNLIEKYDSEQFIPQAMDIVDLKQDPNTTNIDTAPNQGAHLTSMESDEVNDNENNTTPNIFSNMIKEEEDPEDEWKQEEF